MMKSNKLEGNTHFAGPSHSNFDKGKTGGKPGEKNPSKLGIKRKKGKGTEK